MSRNSNRILLIGGTVLAIAGLYFLPKYVVENDSQLREETPATGTSPSSNPHAATPAQLRKDINQLRTRYLTGPSEEKNAIFADSLTRLYQKAGLFDSAAWFAERANTFFKSDESLLKAGNAYYEAYTFAMEPGKQQLLAEKARTLLGEAVTRDPHNLEARTKIAMTYLSSGSPMKGIQMLREVLAEDPQNKTALFNMGMLSIQSGQYAKAAEWLEKLDAVDSTHIQGQLLLGVAYMNLNQKEKARRQFEKVKKMDTDPAVQSAVDSYLQDLK